VRRFFKVFLALVMMVPLSGCLGTMVQSPTAAGRPHMTTRVHLLWAPTQIDAHMCANGLAETFTYVPLWGILVGFLTFSIVVPMTTSYSCVPDAG
jgi:hypothetical protein